MAKQPERLIKNLVPTLTERGKIKIGEKGQMTTSANKKEFQLPKKLDHFKVVTLQRDETGNYMKDVAVHQLHGETPSVLPIRLLYDEIGLNFQCRYACYKKRVQWCTGDGEIACRISEETGEIQNFNCPCHRQNPEYANPADKCKINGCLSVLIDGVETVGGAWKFRTTSYNSVTGILSSLSLIKTITGGPLAGIPLNLTISPKTTVTPITGQTQTVFVVGIEFKGTWEQLQTVGYKKAMERQTHLVKMDDIENEARKLLEMNAGSGIVDEDVVEEFYPEQYASTITATKEEVNAQDLTDQIKNGKIEDHGLRYGDAPSSTESKEPQRSKEDEVFDLIMTSRSKTKGYVLGNWETVKAMSEDKQAKIRERWESKVNDPWPGDEQLSKEGIGAPELEEPAKPTPYDKITENDTPLFDPAESAVRDFLDDPDCRNEDGHIHAAYFMRLCKDFEEKLPMEVFAEIMQDKPASEALMISHPDREMVAEGLIRAWHNLKRDKLPESRKLTG